MTKAIEPTASLHNIVIKLLKASDTRYQAGSFRKAVLHAVDDEWVTEDADRDLQHVRPDLFLVDYAAQEIIAVEVEDTSVMTLDKLRSYAWIWSVLDSDGTWKLRLKVTDRYGKIQELCLMDFYLADVANIGPIQEPEDASMPANG